ncbi:MAG: PilZ domain-containing protein [Desulfuromonadales bacterium]|nr:PilZ domain-containing protein [Chloroflexota bacterium]MCK4621033.1 PilZ domain-containing protein [Desulfuromonadales bacterium]
MIYQRYFKTGQQVLLTALDQRIDVVCTELLTASIAGGNSESFFLTLPYSENATDQFPFTAGMKFEISSEALGLGVRLTGQFDKKIDGKIISLKVNPDLQMFQRRGKPRIDCEIGLRFTRGRGIMKTLRATWEKNIRLLHSPDAPLIFEGFKPCKINLSSAGIRLNLRAPASPTELCLILLNLEDGKAPICALAEIAWTRPEQEETVIVSGMRFINILAEDQARIDNFITLNSRR